PTPGVPGPWPAPTIPFFPAPTGPNPFPDPPTIPLPRIPPNTIPRGPVDPSPSNPYNDPDFARYLIAEESARNAARLKDWLLAVLSGRNQSSDEPAGPKAAPAQLPDLASEPASGIRMLSSPVLGTGPLNPTSIGRRGT